jgi:hypothetical protein
MTRYRVQVTLIELERGKPQGLQTRVKQALIDIAVCQELLKSSMQIRQVASQVRGF